jgi:hypothetical protein
MWIVHDDGANGHTDDYVNGRNDGGTDATDGIGPDECATDECDTNGGTD